MLLEKLKYDELEFMESWHNPICLAECLFSDFDNLGEFEEEKFGELRNYQVSMISSQSLIDFNLTAKVNKLNIKQQQQLKKNVEEFYNFGSRGYGKSMTQRIDIALSSIYEEKLKAGFYSIDEKRMRNVIDYVKKAMEYHPIYKSWVFKCSYKPTIEFRSEKNLWSLKGVNLTLGGRAPGEQFYGLHADKIYGDECCVDGHTKIRFVNEKDELETKNISSLINTGRYKNIKLLSYNLEKNIIEQKKITKIFKKSVKNYRNYKIILDSKIGKFNRTLIVSEKQKIYTDKGYKYPRDLNPKKDKLCLLDHCSLSNTQKQIILGCLLGDASLVSDRKNSKIRFTQGIKQKSYLQYKKSCLNNLFSSYRKNRCTGAITKPTKTSYGGLISYLVSKETKSLNEFSELKSNKNGQSFTELNENILNKHLSPISLAFWYMDDGSIETYHHKKKPNGYSYSIRLHTEGYNLKTNKLLKKCLWTKFKLKAKITKSKRKYYYLRFNTKHSEKFLNLIKSYIHSSMKYKLGNVKTKFVNLIDNEYLLEEVNITKITKNFNKTWTMYDFEVEDNHNFFANGLLISNSFETKVVFDAKKEAEAELGCIYRLAGMTNFTRHSPCGKLFNENENIHHILNYPQYASLYWSEKKKKQKIEDYGGELSFNYLIFVVGEIIEDGDTELDMERIENCWNRKVNIKSFEISKKSFDKYENLIITQRPKNAERIFLNADVGDKVTEIIIHSEVGELYNYLYNITLYNLKFEQQKEIFDFLIRTLNAEVIGIDCGDATGRILCDHLEEVFPPERIIRYAGASKLNVDYEKDNKGEIKRNDKGEILYREEFMREWSVLHLKKLWYNDKVKMPYHSKLDLQMSALIGKRGQGTRTKYLVPMVDDHLFDAWIVFGISQFIKKDSKVQDNQTSLGWGTGASS